MLAQSQEINCNENVSRNDTFESCVEVSETGETLMCSLNILSKKACQFQTFTTEVASRNTLQTIFRHSASYSQAADTQRFYAIRSITKFLKTRKIPAREGSNQAKVDQINNDIVSNSTICLHIALETLGDSKPSDISEYDCGFIYSSDCFKAGCDLLANAYAFSMRLLPKDKIEESAVYYNTKYIVTTLRCIETDFLNLLKKTAGLENNLKDKRLLTLETQWKKRNLAIRTIRENVLLHPLSCSKS